MGLLSWLERILKPVIHVTSDGRSYVDRTPDIYDVKHYRNPRYIHDTVTTGAVAGTYFGNYFRPDPNTAWIITHVSADDNGCGQQTWGGIEISRGGSAVATRYATWVTGEDMTDYMIYRNEPLVVAHTEQIRFKFDQAALGRTLDIYIRYYEVKL
jgi:hypothetical protein